MITSFLSDGAIHVLTVSGYAGLFTLSLLESAAIPIPSEIYLPFAGILVASARFALWPAVAAATLGNMAGSLILYWIGISGGRWILDRYGKYVLIHPADIEKGEHWFERHGVKAVFYGRLLPIVRTFISLPAGISKMDVKKFSVYTILGALPWNLGLIYIGLKAGEHLDTLGHYFHYTDYVIVIMAVIFLFRHFFKKRTHSHAH